MSENKNDISSKKINIKSLAIFGSILVILLLGAFGVFSGRMDLTQEKRYTLSDATVKTLQKIKKPLVIDVYLEGDFPASFRQLRNETEFLLEEFQKVNPKITFKFIDPIKSKMSKDTLQAMGMSPSILPDEKDGKISQIVLFPYATVKYNSYGSTVPLIVSQQGIDANQQLTKSIENLEYNFASTIKSMAEEQKKNVGFLINQQELGPNQFQGFIDMTLENYNIGPVIPENKTELTDADIPKLQKMDALVIAKPRKAFTDGEKVLLDQYIMHGGKTLWLLDAVNAEMDTLFTAKKIMAYPVDNNLTDFMFNYGIRINNALVKDMKKGALIRVSAGEIAGNAQYNSFLWPYFPVGIAENKNVITKNINPVKFEFPTAIDTLGRKNIKTTVLFQSSDRTSVKVTPNLVDLTEIAKADSLGQMEKPTTPKIFSVLLEGKFTSAYANRSEKSFVKGFVAQSPPNKMIVIADGDVAKNGQLKGKNLPLGYDLLTNQTYGNEQFLRNCLDYLLDDENLMSVRDRNLEVRILDRQRIDEEKNKWQMTNLLLPLAIIGLLGGVFVWWRKTKFG